MNAATSDDPDHIHTRAEFAEALTRMREAAGLTIRDLAEATGLRHSTVGGYCSGRHLPSSGQTEVLVRVLRACGVDRADDLDRWVAAVGRARRAPGPRPVDAPAPFRGLESYQIADRDWFFGREDLTHTLVERVVAGTGLLFVVGASGSGKSSLLRAGLLASLTDMPSPPATVLLTPSAVPPAEVAAVLAGKPAVVVVDQFEEVFTDAAADGDALITALTEAAADMKVVLGMRADFYAHAAARPALVAALQHAQVLVGPLTEPQLRRVITEPAKRAQVDIEEGLVELIMRDLVPAETGTLPLLSHVLRTAWLRGHRRRLTIADYRDSGGLRGAVAQSAEEVFAKLDPLHQRLARRLFVQLVHAPEGMAETRRQVHLDDLRTGVDPDDEARDAVLDRFIEARLVTSDANGVRITHEALVQAWPRLCEWIEADRAGLRVYHRLRDAARSWHDTGRTGDGLLRGTNLEMAREWSANPARAADLNRTERAFLDASVALDAAERRTAHRRARVQARLLVAMAILLVISAASAVFAFGQRRIADDVRDTAVSRQVAGDADRLRATDPALARQLALAAYRVSPTPEARSTLYGLTADPAVARFRASQGTVAVTTEPAARLVVTGDNVGGIRLWHVTAGGALTAGASATALDGSIFTLAASHDGRLLAVGGKAGVVTLWRLGAALQRLATIPVDAATVFSLALSPDGRTLVAATAGRGLRRWSIGDPAHPEVLADLPANPAGDVHAVMYAADGRLLAGTPEHTVRVWRADATAVDGLDLTGPTGQVNGIAADAATGAVAVASSDRAVYLWPPGRALVTLRGFTSFANAVRFSPDGALIAATSADGSARFWTVAGGREVRNLPHPGPVTDLAYLGPDMVLTAAADGYARTWALPGAVIGPTSNQVFTVMFDTTGRLAVNAESTTAGAGEVTLWDTHDSAHPRSAGPPLHADGLSGSSAVSRSGRLLAAGAADGSTTLWDTHDPAAPRRFGLLTGPTEQIEAVAFSPDERQLAIGGDDHRVWLWDVARPDAPRLRATLEQPTNLVLNLAFSPSGELLGAASADRQLYLWDVRGAGPVHLDSVTTVSGTYAYALAFSPDGGTIAIGSADKTVRLFDARDPARPRAVGSALTGPTNYVYAVAFSPDGRTLAAGSTDGTVRLWTRGRGDTFTRAATLAAHGAVFTVAFSPDGRMVAAGTGEAQVWLWQVTDPGARAALCGAVGDTITLPEWQQYLPATPFRKPC
ncbi:helix-turn-helix domain-containing protein [Dactylosporangium vinaceum]|uniref:Helix-turn-helix domain-containing protein n=1 Tax=Dactylosporangium vinaceum TaxID=53362 RepID=A0ABV5MK83_9ACTN|nr:helix-turn-helix domain-containing protein [Dactylosporangium vinaceum]UAB99643.1 helix-turn-helix domain-containing protein [Dactylosporangium vinaceum]